MPEAAPAALSLRRRLAAGGAWALGGRVLLALTGLATNALLARLLSPQDLGVFFLAFSVVSFCSVLSSLGLEITVVRFVAESLGLELPGRARRVVNKVIVLGAFGAATVGGAYLLVGTPLVARLFDSPTLAAVGGLIAGWTMVSAFQNIIAETFRGFNDIRLASIFSRSASGFGSLLAGILLTLGLAALWVFDGSTNLATVMILAVGSGLSSTLLAGWLLRSRVRNLPSGSPTGAGQSGEISFRRVLSVTWPLLVNNLALIVLTQADLWIVGAFRSQEEVAVYGAAVRLVALVVTPLLVVNAVVSPLISERYARGRISELQRVLRVTAALAGIPALLALLCFIFLGGPILGLVFGDYYRSGALVLAALSLGQIVSVWTGSCGVTMALTGHQLPMMAITIATSSITIVAGLLLVNQYGVVGVAFASAAGLALQNLSLWLGTRITCGIWTHCNFKSLPGLLRTTLSGRRSG